MKFPSLHSVFPWLAKAEPPSGGRAAGLQPVPVPKVRPGQASMPSYLTTAKPSKDSPLPRVDRNLVNQDLTTVRQGASTRQVLRDMVAASPDLSGAVTSYVRTAITSGYVATAHNMDKTVNPEATQALQSLLTWFDVMTDPALGYDDSASLRGICETWVRELLLEGAMAGELVLNKARLPDKIQPISVGQIRFFPSSDGKRLIPQQVLAGEEISLDIPTFFMVYLDRDVTSVYPTSPLEPAQQPVLFSADFMQDIRRVVKRAIHPRVIVTLNEEKFLASMPLEVQADETKAIEYRNQVLADIEARINGLEPEDALVVFDSIGVEVKDHGNTNLSNEYSVIQKMVDAKMATGAKVLPTALGQSNGTSNTASTEAVLFVKYVEGMAWSKLNEMLSRMLTLAVRIMGYDVYVSFRFNPIDLRPDSELEAFRSMRQSRILDLLSLGLITDEEASIQLTGQLPPAGYKPLSGTGFRASAKTEPAGAGYNGATNDGSTLNQNLKSDAPDGVKGGQGKQDSQKKAAEVVNLRG